MAGYEDTRQKIISTLMGRPVGTEIQPENQQEYELNMLDYIRGLELIATSTLIGIAEQNTTPVQPNNSRVCYIAGVAQNQTAVFENFIDVNGNPISITTGDMEGVLVILMWNAQYWSAQTISTNIISQAQQAIFYYNYNIRKTYTSVSAMNADVANPIGTNEKYIKVGDLVSVVNSTTPSENGIYSYEGVVDGWKYQSSFNFQLSQDLGNDSNVSISQNSISYFIEKYGMIIPTHIKNSYVNSSGEIKNTSGYSVTGKIFVQEGDAFFVKAKTLAIAVAYAYYDVNNVFLSSAPAGDFNSVIIVPSGVKYVIFTQKDSESDYNLITHFPYGIVDLDKIYKSIGINYTFNGYLNSDGIFNALSSYQTTDFINVKEGEYYSITGDTSSGSGKLYSLYDSNKNKVSVSNIQNGNQIVKIPTGVSFLRASSIKTASKIECIKVNNQYTDYVFQNAGLGQNLNIGNTNFYKNNVNSAYSIPASKPNYIVIKIPNNKGAICGIQFTINDFALGSYDKKISIVNAFFFPSVDGTNNDYGVVEILGSLKLDIIYAIKDGNFHIAIPTNLISMYSGIFVNHLYSYFAVPVIKESNNVTFITESDLNNYTIIKTFALSTTKSNLNDITNSYYDVKNNIETGNQMRLSAYPTNVFGNWTGTKTGALAIGLPMIVGDTNTFSGFLMFDLPLFRYNSSSTEQKSHCVLRMSCFLQQSGMNSIEVKVVSGSYNRIFNKIRTALINNQYYLILGDINNTWQFTNFNVTNIRGYHSNGVNYVNDLTANWSYIFITDLSIASNVIEVNPSYDIDLFPNIPIEKITGLSSASNLSEYVDTNYIRTSLKKFFTDLYNKTKNTPFNCLFVGDSIVNFQNGWASGADTELPKVSNNRPLCMYNPDTFTNRLWALLNPKSLDRAYNPKTFGGNMTFIKGTDSGVTKNGTWIQGYNYSTNTYNVGASGGSTSGIKDFMFSTELDASMSFNIPANSKGFSVVAEIQSGNRTYNSVSYQPSTLVEVYLDNVLIDTISMVPNPSNMACQKRFDFVIDSPTASNRVVKIVNKDAGKWVFIWGIESWIDTCVRPINNAVAGGDISVLYGDSSYNYRIAANEPDIIIHEANILNDTRVDLLTTESGYGWLYKKISEAGIPILVLITHAPATSTNETITVDFSKCPDAEDPNQTPRYYNQYAEMLKRVCGRYNIPYINVFQYQYNIYGGVIPSDLFVDGIHLSYKGHQMYNKLIDYAFENNY